MDDAYREIRVDEHGDVDLEQLREYLVRNGLAVRGIRNPTLSEVKKALKSKVCVVLQWRGSGGNPQAGHIMPIVAVPNKGLLVFDFPIHKTYLSEDELAKFVSTSEGMLVVGTHASLIHPRPFGAFHFVVCVGLLAAAAGILVKGNKSGCRRSLSRHVRGTTAIVILILIASGDICSAKNPLVCAMPSHNFGQIEEGTKITHTFTVRNPTGKAIHVRRVVAECGCMTLSRREFWVGPRSETSLDLTFNSLGYKGKRIKKSLLLLCDDGVAEPLELTLQGEIKGLPRDRTVEVMPKTIVFTNTGQSSQDSCVLLMRSPRRDFEWSIAEAPEWVEVMTEEDKRVGPYPPRDEDLSLWRIGVRLRQSAPDRGSGNIVIKSNLKFFESIKIVVRLEPLPIVRVQPPVICMSPGDGRKCRIQFLSGAPAAVSHSPEPMTVTVLDTETPVGSQTEGVLLRATSPSVSVKVADIISDQECHCTIDLLADPGRPEYVEVFRWGKPVARIPVLMR